MLENSSIGIMARLTIVMMLMLVGNAYSQITSKARYLVTDLGPVGNGYCIANGINNAGQICGYTFVDNNSRYRAFIYSNGSMKIIDTLGGDSNFAQGISSLGQVVGGSTLKNGNSWILFTYHNGSVKRENAIMSPHGINSSGQIVGESYSGDILYAVTYLNGSTAKLDSFGGMESSAYAINDKGQIVGRSDYPDGRRHAFLFKDDTMITDLGTLGGNWSSALAVNNNGSVTGSSSLTGDKESHAFIYMNGKMSDLGTLKDSTSSAYGINIRNEVVGDSVVDSKTGTLHAFVYSDGAMKDLNDLIDPQSGFVLETATGINDSGQIIGYGRYKGVRPRSFLLSPPPEIIQKQPEKPVYGNLPVKEDWENCLTIVAHGWQPYPGTPDVSWVDRMSNAINSYVVNQHLNNWHVHGYKWVENAWKVNPQTALNIATSEGVYLGKCLVLQKWAQIHFIGFSAGAEVIQAASKVVKDSLPSCIIQCTFLDPFVGLNLSHRKVYGNSAKWSDCYLSNDPETSGGFYPTTDSALDYAYNVDVTQLNKVIDGYAFTSSLDGMGAPCHVTIPSHGWPIDFYMNTINENTTQEYRDFGFLLSQEGGNWNYANANYSPGNKSPLTLGTPDDVCISLRSANVSSEFDPNFTESQLLQSGTVLINGSGFELVTHSPSWIIGLIPLTNSANSVTFNAIFVSTNKASGLLSVYWDTNNIGSIDESVTEQGIHNYKFSFNGSKSNSVHRLGFRIDPFSEMQSSVLITNITLSQIGVSQPFNLSVTTNTFNRLPVMRLSGELNYNYLVQVSTNLVNWSAVAVLVNTNGSVDFVDNISTNHNTLFYRAIVP